MLIVDIKTQTLTHYKNNKIIAKHPVSTAKNGTGEKDGSECTPMGRHKICAKIGTDLSINSVLVGRKCTSEIYNEKLALQYPDRDWILTRVLWLDGLEDFNKNTKQRYIYIHGMPDNQPINIPNSKGCIRMHNNDIVVLFNTVKIDDLVIIK